MPSIAFSELVDRLIDAFGQRLGIVRNVGEGVLLKTTDGFLYAFYEDPLQLSLAMVQRLLQEMPGNESRIVLFTPGHMPLALRAELQKHRATVVDANMFEELARGLDLGSFLGREPRGEVPTPPRRLLPSAQLLDDQMRRAHTWLQWGVPAVALRFYRQSAELKPEFLPARTGIARSLLGLGLVDDAKRAFDAILTEHPDDFDARLGRAAVTGATGNVDAEVEEYRALLNERPDRLAARASLIAALVDARKWAEAREELEVMLRATPEDARLRFLLGVALEKTGDSDRALREREGARKLGLSVETERALCLHLGLPVPRPEVPAAPPPTPAPTPGRVPMAQRAPAARPVPAARAAPAVRRASSARKKESTPRTPRPRARRRPRKALAARKRKPRRAARRKAS